MPENREEGWKDGYCKTECDEAVNGSCEHPV